MTNETSDQKGTALSTRALTPAAWRLIHEIAPIVAASKFVPNVYTPEQAAVVLMTGHELGFGHSASLRLVQSIPGRMPGLSAAGILAVIRRSGLLESIKVDETPESCSCTMTRRGGETYSVTWTLDKARRAGLLPMSTRPYDDKHRGGWEKYPENLLRWRAIKFCGDYLFGDLLGGLYSVEEFDADEHGEVIDTTFTPAPVVSATVSELATPDAAVTLDELIAAHGAEAVLAAAGGQLPESGEGTARAAAALALGLLVHYPHDPAVGRELGEVRDYPAANGPAPSTPALEQLVVELSESTEEIVRTTRARAATEIARLLRARADTIQES